MKTRAAVVGVGYLGRFHAQKLAANPDVELVGVCDAREEAVAAVAKELGVKPFTNPKDLKGQVDLVSIAASTKAHFEIAGLFLEAGIPTLVEKPIAARVDEAEALVRTAERNKTFFAVGHIERYNPTYQKVRELLRDARHFDFIRHTAFRARGADVSVVHDLMIHDLDLLGWLAGAEIKDMQVSGSRWVGADVDAADVFVRLNDGRTATLSASRVSTRPQRALRVLGKEQILFADSASGDIDILKPQAGVEPLPQETLKVEKQDALAAEIGDVVARLRAGQGPLVDGRAGLAALRHAETICRSLGTLK